MEHTLDEIVVVPRNGYVNRLQAWASATILAAQLDVPLRVVWETEDAAPAAPDQLFASALIARRFLDRASLDARLGSPHQHLPRYLTIDMERRLVVLAGHDRGEQVFMPELGGALGDQSRPTTLLIIAGGKFHVDSSEDFQAQRRLFYRRMTWSTDLDTSFNHEVAGHGSYVALHVRGTDRSRQAPPARTIRAGLDRLRDLTAERSLFIAADTAVGRDRWSSEADSLGFRPWSAREIDFDRSNAGSGVDALLDWRLLGASRGVVYTGASSFGEEAAIATGHLEACVPLSATSGRQRVRAASELGRAAITYPRRQGWLGGSTRDTLPAEES